MSSLINVDEIWSGQTDTTAFEYVEIWDPSG